jgi:putative SOS response-associated peptidase YedK
LVPVTEFFQSNGDDRYVVTLTTGPFALGGIWETWLNPNTEKPLTSFALITTPANDLISPVAERMPLIIYWSRAL